MSCHFLYTTVLTVLLTSANALADVKVTDHTDQTRDEINKGASTTTGKEAATKEPDPRVAPKYVLQDRETGKVISFSEASILDTLDSLRAVDVPMDKWHSCSAQPGDQGAPDQEPSLEDLEKSLEVTLLIDSLASVPAPELTDSQRDWVQTLSPCAPAMRLHLKALSLILTNYKIIQKPDA